MLANDDERAWLAEHYPGLKPTDSGTIEGRLSFQMLHLDGKHYIRPTPDFVASNFARGIYICDTYEVKIVPQQGRGWPLVHETGSRIEAVAARMGKPMADLHLYADGRGLCLASIMDLNRTFADGFNLAVFIDEFLVPYMFEQTYFARNEIWPWGELAHGYLGLLQWLGRDKDFTDVDVLATYDEILLQPDAKEARELLTKRCRGHKPCPCGSSKKARECCPDVKDAISRIRHAINRGVIVPE